MSSAIPSACKLYRVYFSQPNNADHEALLLIPQVAKSDTHGYIHHVIGMLALGMEYQMRSTRDVRKEKGYSYQTFLGEVADIDRVEIICRATEPPMDERLLFTNRDKIEATGEKLRDCAAWIDEVLVKLEIQGLFTKSN